MGNVVTSKGGRTAASKEARGTGSRPDSKLARSRRNAANFLRETWMELRWKTTWPKKDELIRSTVLVIAVVLIVAAYIGLADVIVAALTRPLFR